MSAVLNLDDPETLAFQKGLQGVLDSIAAAPVLEETLKDISADLCTIFGADRVTVYVVNEDKSSIISKLKSGLTNFRELKLPIGEQSIAGFAAASRRVLNVKDAYDTAELKRISPGLRFLQEVDKRTGYRSVQQLAAPIGEEGQELYGVVQFLNTKSGGVFPLHMEEGIRQLCQSFATHFRQRRERQGLSSKYATLVQEGIVTADELEEANRTARKRGLSVEKILVEETGVKPADIGNALSKFFGVPYEPHKPDRIKPLELLRNLKREYSESNQWVPVEETKEGLLIVSPDPEKIRSSKIVTHVFPRHKLRFAVTSEPEFKDILNSFFGYGGEAGDIDDLLEGLDEGDVEEFGGGQNKEELSAAADNELVKLVNKIIIDGYHQGASDIHVESYPGKGKTEIRFRKDGSLGPYIEVPASYRNALVARIKIMCDLDISEKRKPQDGKIKFRKYGPLDIELRVATIPTQGGVEDIVMRILAAGEPIPIDKLGISPNNLPILKKTVSKPYGLFFVCGPTGSGKTTTLHSILSHLNQPDTKIWTAEDPIEITQKGLRQVQVNRKAGLDFATVMKSFLRADPDIIMVGEMRDKETTSIGIEASLTGHLVLATLHTNSAPESIVRLLDMGMDPFNFADALVGVLAQRLAKRLCPRCKQAYSPDAEELKLLMTEYSAELQNSPFFKENPKAAYEKIYAEWVTNFANEKGEFTMYRKVGCDGCGKSGYRGRVGLHELMVASDTVKRHVQERSRVADLLATSLQEGMRTLKMDGIEKILSGLTDIAQVRAVCIK
jgi:type II secretory ATPase GspE/PulE/Tfp pilus assembly ATPase PilB-like protein